MVRFEADVLQWFGLPRSLPAGSRQGNMEVIAEGSDYRAESRSECVTRP